MKTFLTILMFSIAAKIFAQVPQGISYQAVVRDEQGNIIANQTVQFRFTILQDAYNGTPVFQEIHVYTTNPLGLAILSIGNGAATIGSLSAVDWANHPHFLRVELDPQGGTNFIEMGTTQLLSVPYAMHAQTAANVQTYTAGNGISITGGVITNTAPDQPITLTGQGATTVSGTYPNFTISSTDNNTTYTAGTGLNLTGTTFSHAPHSGDVSGTTNLTVTGIQGRPVSNVAPTNQQVLQFNGTQWVPVQPSNIIQPGTGLSYTGNTLNSVWTQSGNNIYNNNTGRVGIGITSPTGKVTIQGDTSNVLFEVRDKDGKQVFVVYQDSVYVFVDATASKTNKGTFAVSSKAQTKSTTQYLRITPDSSRVYTEDPEAGFGVRDINSGTSVSYMQLTPENYFIGHEAGKSYTTGKYNSFLGYQAGYKTNIGYKNYFIGYRSGYNNTSGYSNIFIGDSAGFSNTTGLRNIFIGNQCGFTNTTGMLNVFIGYQSGFNNNGNYNIFIGYESGKMNTTGYHNTFFGFKSAYSNTSGYSNIMIGPYSGYTNTTGSNNIFLGYYAGYNSNANYNVFLGYEAGRTNSTGSNNTFLGFKTGRSNTTGISNVYLGNSAGFSGDTASYNIFLGHNAGYSNKTNYNVAIGYESGFSIIGGSQNTFLGYMSGREQTSGWFNVCIGSQAGRYTNTTYSVFIGTLCGHYAQGDDNVYIGYSAGRLTAARDNMGTVMIGSETGYNMFGGGNTIIGSSAGGTYTSTPTERNNNIFIGEGAGRMSVSGGLTDGNICIGNGAGYSSGYTGSNQLFIENSGDVTNPLIHGNFSTNRVAFHRTATTYPLQVGTSTSNGNAAYLTAGGTWTNASSKTFKDRFEMLNKNDLFSKIEQLEIKAWYYKETKERHIGPFAEDFYHAFGTGVLDEPIYLGRSLAASDVAGVSLAAVKELIKENKELKSELESLKNEIKQIKKSINIE